MRKCQGDLAHYEVISPDMTDSYGDYEPPDYFACYVVVLSRNARNAKILAVKHPDMKKWVTEARGDMIPPFKGLIVKKTLCAHDKCWICETCSECDDFISGEIMDKC